MHYSSQLSIKCQQEFRATTNYRTSSLQPKASVSTMTGRMTGTDFSPLVENSQKLSGEMTPGIQIVFAFHSNESFLKIFSIQRLSVSECQRSSLVFDRSVVQSSLVEDFDFLCENTKHRAYMGTAYMWGMLVGSTVVGYISGKDSVHPYMVPF